MASEELTLTQATERLRFPRQAAELAPARRIEPLEAPGEVCERHVAELVDQALHLSRGTELLVALAAEPGNVGVLPTGPGSIEQAFVAQAAHHRHERRVRPGWLGAAVERLHHELDRGLPLAPDLFHDLGLEFMKLRGNGGRARSCHAREDRPRLRRCVVERRSGLAPARG